MDKLSKEQKKLYTWLAAGAILLFMFLIALFSSKGIFGDPGDSGTVDEVAHIPSGFSYVKYLDFRLNPEHPPLAKVIAGIPLALQNNINGIKTDWSWNGINQWEAGWYILYEAGNDPAHVLFWARLPMMLLMIGLGLFIFKWAKKLYGAKVALLVLAVYALYPDVIAHGRLVTTDVAAAFGYVVSIYYFTKAIENRSTKSTVYAGLAFALAQLLKFSAVLLFGIFVILIIAKAVYDRKKDPFWQNIWSMGKIYFWTVVISLLAVWVVYIPFVWNTSPAIEHTVIERNIPQSEPIYVLAKSFLHSFENNAILRGLGHYLLGIGLVFARVVGGNATFIMGHLSDKSISWYFPVAWLLKTPISIIIFFFWSIIAYAIGKKSDKEKWFMTIFATPVIVYWLFTLKGSLNIGIRHLLPTIPFVLLMIGFLFSKILTSKQKLSRNLVVVLLAFLAVSTLSYYPNYIGYFNESVPRNERYQYLVDSSLDWGQDLLRLEKFIDENNISSINVDYFGGSVPSYYIPEARQWHSSYGPATGWFAVSATFYQSSKLYGPMEGKWSYEWLDKFKPVKVIGGSILIFNISEQDLKANPPSPSYRIRQVDYPFQVSFQKNEV